MLDTLATMLGSAAGGALGAADTVLGAPRRALWGAIGLPDTGAELASNITGMEQDHPLSQILGLAAEVGLDPLTYAGGLIGKGAGMGLRALGGAADSLPALRRARQGFSMVHDLEGAVPTAVGNLKNTSGIAQAAEELGQQAGRAKGFYSPELKAGAALDPVAGRHEVVHGLIDQASKSGDTAGLPALIRAPAALRQGLEPGATGVRAGIADVLDELAAHTYEQKGLANQLGGAANFLVETPWNMGRRAAYQNQFAQTSPLAAKLYRAAGYAPHAALGGGALAGYSALED